MQYPEFDVLSSSVIHSQVPRFQNSKSNVFKNIFLGTRSNVYIPTQKIAKIMRLMYGLLRSTVLIKCKWLKLYKYLRVKLCSLNFVNTIYYYQAWSAPNQQLQAILFITFNMFDGEVVKPSACPFGFCIKNKRFLMSFDTIILSFNFPTN